MVIQLLIFFSSRILLQTFVVVVLKSLNSFFPILFPPFLKRNVTYRTPVAAPNVLIACGNLPVYVCVSCFISESEVYLKKLKKKDKGKQSVIKSIAEGF